MRLFARIAFIGMLGASPGVWAASGHGQHFDRVMTVIFENTNFSSAMAQPFFAKLAGEGVNFTHFSAEAHPSQGNYIAYTSGDLNGVRNDRPVDVDAQNVADLLEAHGLTWKVYAEGYPGNCFTGTQSGRYARKHNPFISYVNIQKNPERCSHIVSADEFDSDLASGNLPEYVFYIPDMDNDGHDTGAAYADKWYQGRFASLFSDTKFMSGTLVISTFDENAGRPGNMIYTTMIGPMVKAGGIDQPVNHYSLLKMIEDNWSLGNLGKQDASASSIANIWQ